MPAVILLRSMVLSLDSQFPAGIIMQSLYIAQLYDACWGQGQFCIPSRAILGGQSHAKPEHDNRAGAHDTPFHIELA